VHGCPSDHRRPSRKCSVHSDWSALASQLSAKPGPTSTASFSQRRGEWPYMYSFMTALAVLSMSSRKVPPYFPRSSQLCGTTYGRAGRRSSTGGKVPAFTISARSGASWNRGGTGNGLVWEPLPTLAFGREGSASWEPSGVHAVNRAVPAPTADAYRNARRLIPLFGR